MKRTLGMVVVLALFLVTAGSASAQEQSGGQIININVSRSIQTVNYRTRGSTKIDFTGTPLLPRAEGKATVESKEGSLRITAEVNGLVPAGTFGPEYLTYVLWAITPEGRATNLGELMPDGSKSKLEVTTRLQTFGMIVTAEPYFAVSAPSDVVVYENTVRSDTKGGVDEVNAKTELLQRGRYSEAHLTAYEITGREPLVLLEARNALRIAKWQHADKYAADSYAKAQDALARAEDYQARKQKKTVATAAREAVQAAEDARSISVKRQMDERTDRERQEAADREAQAKAAQASEAQARATAEQQRMQAEVASAKDAQARAEADRQRAEAERQRAEADQQRTAALAAQQNAEAQQAAALAAQKQAQDQAAQSEREKQELRARLMEQFNRVLPTKDSPRGLVVNLGDVLFDFGKADLRVTAREALAKLSGIVLNYPSLRLEVEGHTDSVGGTELNQRLSEKRADSVKNYLTAQGVPADSLVSRGLGEGNPVADNSTAAGRQLNRRVEIIVSGEVIGHQIGAPQQ